MQVPLPQNVVLKIGINENDSVEKTSCDTLGKNFLVINLLFFASVSLARILRISVKKKTISLMEILENAINGNILELVDHIEILQYLVWVI